MKTSMCTPFSDRARCFHWRHYVLLTMETKIYHFDYQEILLSVRKTNTLDEILKVAFHG